jgi:Membrane protease subunits, stomatin/prohibitin homologs
MKMKNMGKLIFGGVIAFFVLLIVLSSMTTVSEGSVGVKYRMGRLVDIGLEAGMHFKMPFIEEIERVDVTEQSYEVETSAYTRDTQTIESVMVKLNYVYNRAELKNIIQTVGIGNVESKLIVPQVNSILKNATGQFKAEELVQGRSTLQEKIEKELRESLERSGITVVSFNILNIDFEDAFEQAIRLKVEAEQEALRKKNETLAKREEAAQKIIAAEATAEAQRLEADAEAYAIEKIQEQLKASPEYIELMRVQKWDGKYPQVMGDTVNPFVTLTSPSPEASPAPAPTE